MSNDITFSELLSHYNIVGMAIAIAIGIAGQKLFFSLADDIVVPSFSFLIKKSTGKSMKGLLKDQSKFQVGEFISAVLTFLIVIGVVIFILLTILRPIVKREILTKREGEEKIDNALQKLHGIEKELDEVNDW